MADPEPAVLVLTVWHDRDGQLRARVRYREAHASAPTTVATIGSEGVITIVEAWLAEVSERYR